MFLNLNKPFFSITRNVHEQQLRWKSVLEGKERFSRDYFFPFYLLFLDRRLIIPSCSTLIRTQNPLRIRCRFTAEKKKKRKNHAARKIIT